MAIVIVTTYTQISTSLYGYGNQIVSPLQSPIKVFRNLQQSLKYVYSIKILQFLKESGKLDRENHSFAFV